MQIKTLFLFYNVFIYLLFIIIVVSSEKTQVHNSKQSPKFNTQTRVKLDVHDES